MWALELARIRIDDQSMYGKLASTASCGESMPHKNSGLKGWFLLLSLNRDGLPGVREHHMRDDFSSLFQFEWLRRSGTEGQKSGPDRPRWSAMLHRKGID